jgi:hypothetical protein
MQAILGVNLVLGILKMRGLFYNVVRIAKVRKVIHYPQRTKRTESDHYPHHTLYPISYQGGGDYRGIYDMGFKRGFYGV